MWGSPAGAEPLRVGGWVGGWGGYEKKKKCLDTASRR